MRRSIQALQNHFGLLRRLSRGQILGMALGLLRGLSLGVFLGISQVLLLIQPASAATIVITDLEDVDFGDLPPTTSEITQRIRICVNSRPPGPYQLTALGLNSSGSFELSNDARETLAYDVFAGRRRNQLGNPLVPGVAATGFSARQPNPAGRCRPPWLWITIVVEESVLEQAASGRYHGTLQLTVAPE